MKRVVAAVIEKDGKVLIARRRKETGFGGFWEFPGGSIEKGETPEKALAREIAEELGVQINVGGRFHQVEFRSPALAIRLTAYRAALISGEFVLTDHDEVRWASPYELNEKDFSEPDRPVVRLLRKK